MLVDLLANLTRNGQYEFCTEAQVRAQALSKVLRTIVRIVDVPLKLVAQNHVSDTHVQLDRLDKLAVHLAVLAERGHLLFELRHYLVFEAVGQIEILD